MRLILTLSLGSTLLGSALAGDWPQFLGPHRDGSATDEAIVSQLGPAGRPILWKREAGEGFSGPVVQGSQLILFHGQPGEEVVEALQAVTGQPIWKVAYRCPYAGGYGTGPGPRATPAIAQGKVFTFGAAGTIQALEAATGKLLWRRDLAKEYDLPEGFFGVGTSPLPDGDQLLVTVGARRASLVSFDQQTGQTRWIASDDEASYASPVLQSLDGQKRALFFARTGLHVVDPSNGQEVGFFRWRARMNASVNAATPISVGNEIFLSAEYGTGATLLRWNQNQLEPVWKSQEALSCHFNTPVAVDGHLIGIDGRQEGGAQLRCIEWKSGQPTWSKEGFGCAALIRVGPTIVATTEEGELILFEANPKAYQERGRQRIGTAPTRAHPALANGLLYLRTPDQLLAVDLRP
jgi:outer membrane protein assembly factor BamB